MNAKFGELHGAWQDRSVETLVRHWLFSTSAISALSV
jgi:hypothetical protein